MTGLKAREIVLGVHIFSPTDGAIFVPSPDLFGKKAFLVVHAVS